MTPPSKTALAARTIEQITSGMNSGQAPCLPELVQLIQTLSAKAIDVSVTELAELVQKDVSVMTKVLTAANTLGYNPGGVPIGTVTQAIQVIGFDHIRTLAMSLMLMRHADDSQSAEEKRQATMLALSSGLVAQSLSQTHGIAAPEEADPDALGVGIVDDGNGTDDIAGYHAGQSAATDDLADLHLGSGS